MKKNLILIALVAFALESCSKYDDPYYDDCGCNDGTSPNVNVYPGSGNGGSPAYDYFGWAIGTNSMAYPTDTDYDGFSDETFPTGVNMMNAMNMHIRDFYDYYPNVQDVPYNIMTVSDIGDGWGMFIHGYSSMPWAIDYHRTGHGGSFFAEKMYDQGVFVGYSDYHEFIVTGYTTDSVSVDVTGDNIPEFKYGRKGIMGKYISTKLPKCDIRGKYAQTSIKMSLDNQYFVKNLTPEVKAKIRARQLEQIRKEKEEAKK